jgi:hypothetical protein
MKNKKRAFLLSLMILVTLHLGFNGLGIDDKKDSSIINKKLQKCISKYSYFFPIRTKGSSHQFIDPSPNFLKFCHCRHPFKDFNPKIKVLAKIDFCSNQHLDDFEHEKLFELNAKLIIEPDLSSRIGQHLKFAGPAIKKSSIYQTRNCMLKTILVRCKQHKSLNRMKKCSLNYLDDNWLYQKLYKNCHALKFGPVHELKVNKI